MKQRVNEEKKRVPRLRAKQEENGSIQYLLFIAIKFSTTSGSRGVARERFGFKINKLKNNHSKFSFNYSAFDNNCCYSIYCHKQLCPCERAKA